MAQTALTPITGVLTNPTAGVALTFTAADTANGNKFAHTGKELIIAQNTGGSAYTVTISSAADSLGRTKDITTDSIAAGAFAIYGVPQVEGWRQTDGTIHLTASNAAIKFAIVRLP
jgi:hypothetical protein